MTYKQCLKIRIFFLLITIYIGSIFSDQLALLNTIMDCRQIFHSEKTDQGLSSCKFNKNSSELFYTADRSLFRHYPELKKKLAWIELADLPTPVRCLEQLGKHLGHSGLYLKDDGMTDPEIGGNKLRKLEPILADALLHGVKDIFTFGVVGSNCMVQTCYACKRVGLECSIFLIPEPNSLQVRSNLLLDYQFGAHFYYYPDNEFRKIGALDTVVQYHLLNHKFPYVVPVGASSWLGMVGYINAAFELKEQIDKGLLPEPDFIYIPIGSFGTVVGLALGLKAAGIKSHIIGITTSKITGTRKVVTDQVPANEVNYYQSEFLKLAHQTNQFLHGLDGSFPLFDASECSITFDENFVGKGYAYFTPAGLEAIKIFKKYENLDLEAVYTGKCVAALIEHIQTNPDLKNKTILFWNTFGINQQVQDEQLYKQLPKPLQRFFEEPVQEELR